MYKGQSGVRNNLFFLHLSQSFRPRPAASRVCLAASSTYFIHLAGILVYMCACYLLHIIIHCQQSHGNAVLKKPTPLLSSLIMIEERNRMTIAVSLKTNIKVSRWQYYSFKQCSRPCEVQKEQKIFHLTHYIVYLQQRILLILNQYRL